MGRPCFPIRSDQARAHRQPRRGTSRTTIIKHIAEAERRMNRLTNACMTGIIEFDQFGADVRRKDEEAAMSAVLVLSAPPLTARS